MGGTSLDHASDLRDLEMRVSDDARCVSVEVTLAAAGPIGRLDSWGEEILAERVRYFANRFIMSGRVVVSVTVYTASGMRNRSWYDPRHFVAQGLDDGPPPAWVPDAPEWFWNAVEDMATSIDAPDALSSTPTITDRTNPGGTRS